MSWFVDALRENLQFRSLSGQSELTVPQRERDRLSQIDLRRGDRIE